MEDDEDDKASAASLAKTLAMMCVRNTVLEDLHAGKVPVSKTGDFSDVKVVHAEGEIAWNDLSRLSDDEMRLLMKQIVDRLYTFFLASPDYGQAVSRWADAAAQWDDPELDEAFLRYIGKKKLPSASEE